MLRISVSDVVSLILFSTGEFSLLDGVVSRCSNGALLILKQEFILHFEGVVVLLLLHILGILSFDVHREYIDLCGRLRFEVLGSGIRPDAVSFDFGEAFWRFLSQDNMGFGFLFRERVLRILDTIRAAMILVGIFVSIWIFDFQC